MIKADGGGGALVYIVLAVISLIVSAVSKSQHKKMPQAPTAPQQPEPIPAEPQPTWQQELEDIFGKVFTEPERKPEPAPVEPVDNRVAEWNKYAQARESKPEETHTKSNHEVIEEEEHHELAIAEEFDLQRAVVYSEVLNRKYF